MHLTLLSSQKEERRHNLCPLCNCMGRHLDLLVSSIMIVPSDPTQHPKPVRACANLPGSSLFHGLMINLDKTFHEEKPTITESLTFV
jgi:hypothetical protein